MPYENGNRVSLITMRMGNHADASGYDRLADFLDAQVIHPIERWTLRQRIIARSFKLLIDRAGSQWYHRAQFYGELQAAKQWFRQSGQIFHFLYGENSYRYLGYVKSAANRNFIVCTFHTPANKFQDVMRHRKHLTLLDAIIVVSSSQVEFFTHLVGSERVFYVPHGIDVDYFRPAAKTEPVGRGLRCLFVGSHLRDFTTLARAAELLERWGKNPRLSVVAPARFHPIFAGMDNAEVHSNVSDEKLLEFYQHSDILVLPVLSATANNSLLEAMACGLPIVSTDLPSVRDYVTDECSLLTPKGDSQALAEAILCLQEDEDLRRKMARASRSHSLHFSWQKIAGEVSDVYEHVRTHEVLEETDEHSSL